MNRLYGSVSPCLLVTVLSSSKPDILRSPISTFKIHLALWKTAFIFPLASLWPTWSNTSDVGNPDHCDAFGVCSLLLWDWERKDGRWLRCLLSRGSCCPGVCLSSVCQPRPEPSWHRSLGRYMPCRDSGFPSGSCGLSSPPSPSLLFPLCFHNSIALLSLGSWHCLEPISTTWRSARERKLENSD